MELCPSSKEWVNISKSKNPELGLRELTIQLILTLDYLHSIGIYHCDIKTFNMLVDNHDDKLTLKLIDFGISKFGNHPQSDTLASAGFQSPEQFKKVPHYPKDTEAWQIGIILFLITHDMYPFGGSQSV